MRSIVTCLALLLACKGASAQSPAWSIDSAVMGPSYAKDVYKNLANTYSDTATGNNWTLAFQIIPQGGPSSNVAVFANQVRQNVSVYSLHYSAAAKFSTLTAADTVGRTSQPLYNSDTTWTKGALNQMGDPTDPFDFSWGYYNQTTHNLMGDSLYLLRTPSAAYKLWIQKYVSYPIDSIRYEFRIAKFDGSADTTIKLYRKNGFTNSLFAYYDAPTRTILNREPARNNWTFVFTRYMEQVTQGTVTMMYPVMGVLHNVGTSVARVQSLNPDAVMGSYASQTYSSKINAIGSDWKQFLGTTGPWVVDTARNYFVKSGTNNTIYQLLFTGFGGSGNGKTYYRYRPVGSMVGTTTVEKAAPQVLLTPNPATNAETHVVIETTTTGKAQLLLTDAMGRMVQSHPVQLTAGLNAFRLSLQNLPAGTYFVMLANGSWKQTQQLLIP